MLTRFVLWPVLGASLALAADKVAEVVTREASGEAAIVGGNVDRAAREAKEAALREAVEQVAGVLISAQSISANSQLISDQVFSHSAGYVRSYQVLSQTQDKGVVKVTVRAEVGTRNSTATCRQSRRWCAGSPDAGWSSCCRSRPSTTRA